MRHSARSRPRLRGGRALLIGSLAAVLGAPVAASCGRSEEPAPAPVRARQLSPEASPAADAGHPDASPDGGDARPDGAAQPATDELEAYRQLAVARALVGQDGRQADAVAAFRRAVEADGSLSFIRSELAAACLAAGDAECAASEARSAADASEDDPVARAAALLTLAETAERRGDRAAAVEALSGALRARPSRAGAARLARLSGGDGGPAASPDVVTCPRGRPGDSPGVAAARDHAEARGRAVCALPEAPEEAREPGGVTTQIDLFAALAPHPDAPSLLGSEAGLGASGDFTLLLVESSIARPRVLVLDTERRTGGEEIVQELTAELRRITLGPSRQGLVVVVHARGIWGVSGRDEDRAVPFERGELFVVGTAADRTTVVAHQVTLERGYTIAEDCLRGQVARPVERRGVVWLEDIDLSGVPEVCQETIELVSQPPPWEGASREGARTAAACTGWVASEIRRLPNPVPSVELDEMDRERAVGDVLEVSRVPVSLHAALRPQIRNGTILAARALELTRSGMHGLAVIVDDTRARALAVSAGDAINTIDLVELGRWVSARATVEAPGPGLVTIDLEASGGQPEGLARRAWYFGVAGGPGMRPTLAIDEETGRATPIDADPCPSVVTTSVERETEEGVLFLSFQGTRSTGPGSRAVEAARQQLCQQLRTWATAPDAGPSAAAPRVRAEDLCPVAREELAPARFVQGDDRRFAPIIVP